MNRIDRNKGFTLMEVAISIAVFAIVLVTSVFVLTAAHQLSTQSRERLLALTAARSTLETIKNTPLANVDNIPQATLDALVPTAGGIPITAGGVMLLRQAGATPVIQVLTDPPIVGLNTNIAVVTVRVTWAGPKNITQVLELTTMRSRF